MLASSLHGTPVSPRQGQGPLSCRLWGLTPLLLRRPEKSAGSDFSGASTGPVIVDRLRIQPRRRYGGWLRVTARLRRLTLSCGDFFPESRKFCLNEPHLLCPFNKSGCSFH